MARSAEQFQTIHTEGAILPPDVLQRVATGELEGLDPTTYHLPTGTKTKEAISQSWTRLLRYWKDFQAARKLILDSDETGSLTTREKWLLPLFQELGYGRLTTAKAPEIDGKLFPIERFWQHIPIHLIGCKLDLDHRTKGARGAATAIPHSMVQEFLNRSKEHAWGFLSNGLQLRVLRDSAALSRQSYVEFDLESMMDGEVYADFAVLWLVCHQSRLEGDKPEDFWLEKWSKLAQEQGTRILEDLRIGVQKAIEALGRGFVSHPRNDALIARLQSGTLSTQDYYRQILRIVYRLLFLFVAEDRGLLHPTVPSDESARPDYDAACSRYDKYYSLRRLRDLAESYRGSKHADLWHSLSLLFDALGKPEGCPQLALPVLGSFLWSRTAVPDLSGPPQLGVASDAAPVFIRNEDLLEAVRSLAFVERNRVLRAVNYRNLGSEELGSVYESLLELHPQINVPGRSFSLNTAAGNERKTTGSYYTPTSLVNCLLDSALEPVVADAIKGKRGPDAEAAILKLKVCDPACGSGHFLMAAAHRLAYHLARARTGEAEPSPAEYQHSLRDVIGHCIYGVDLNPMAVELCKVSLWMEALEPGKPLSFLDHRIQVGNSLLGTTPALVSRGIPDEAFEPIEGDDKMLCREYKRQNKDERKGQGMLFGGDHKPWEQLGNLAASLATLDAVSDETIDGVRLKQRSYEELVASSTYETGRLLADTWCAAFVWHKTKRLDYPITEAIFRRIETNPHDIAPWMRDEIRRLAQQYQFFHWHLSFPGVFSPITDPAGDDVTGWNGGFDLVLGNPPWERTAFEEVPYFLTRKPGIADAATTAIRQQLIKQLEYDDPALFAQYQLDRRADSAFDTFLSGCGRYSVSSGGRTNTYAIFTDLAAALLSASGRCGIVVPTGIATDTPLQHFWGSLVTSNRIVSLFDFENRGVFFESVHSSYKFSLLTLCGPSKDARQVSYGFFLHEPQDTTNSNVVFRMSKAELTAVNPITSQPPVCRTRRDFDILLGLQQRGVVAGQVHPAWVGFTSAGSSEHWMPQTEQVDTIEMEKLYEAKLIHQFDHRYSTYAGCSDIDRRQGRPVDFDKSTGSTSDIQTRFLVPRPLVSDFLLRKSCLLPGVAAYRDVARSTDERTMIAAIIPFAGLMQPLNGVKSTDAVSVLLLIGCLNSFALDFAARLKTPGIHLNVTIFNQLPLISPQLLKSPPSEYFSTASARFLADRVLELTYTSVALRSFAVSCGYDGPPFRWDEERRFKVRCELDASYFHLYGIVRDDVDYIMETFPIVKRKDIDKHGDYRTKRIILEIYDAMAEATRTGQPYQTRLDPPPAAPRVAHPPKSSRRVVIPTLSACELMVLMLDEWRKPVQRMVADRGLILALNDAARGRVLSSQGQPLGATTSQITPEVNFDIVWKTLQATNHVTLTDSGTSVVVSRVADTPLEPTDAKNLQRAKEAIEAFKLIEQRRADWPTEVDDVQYAFS